MRVGELLVMAGLATQAQVDEALRAQVGLGVRLGTILVESHDVDLDELAKVLGKQHGLPAALESHFERADTRLQALLSAELAEAYACVPLVAPGSRVVIASLDPIDEPVRARIAADLGIEPQNLIVAIAPELRIRYYLERVYGVARSQRYLRVPPELSYERERRRYMKTLAELAERHEPNKERLQRATGNVVAVDEGGRPRSATTDLLEMLARIELAPNRSEVARLGIEAIAQHEPSCQAAVLLSIRGNVAVSWTSFVRDGTELPPIAVRLDKAGLAPAAIKRKEVTRGFAGDLGATDFVLIAALGAPHGELVMAPIGVDGEVLMLVAIALPQRVELMRLEAITGALSSAFTRLIEQRRNMDET